MAKMVEYGDYEYEIRENEDGFETMYNDKGRVMVLNEWDVVFDFEDAAGYMVDEIREDLHYELAPCAPQEFFDAYIAAHAERCNEEWELAKKNPIW